MTGSTASPYKNGGCEESGCHKTQLEYALKIEEIVAAMELSAECHQSIMTNCTFAPLKNVAWWTDRENQRRHYWDGDFLDGKNDCKCATEQSGCTPNIFGQKVTVSVQIFLSPKFRFANMFFFLYKSWKKCDRLYR